MSEIINEGEVKMGRRGDMKKEVRVPTRSELGDEVMKIWSVLLSSGIVRLEGQEIRVVNIEEVLERVGAVEEVVIGIVGGKEVKDGE